MSFRTARSQPNYCLVAQANANKEVSLRVFHPPAPFGDTQVVFIEPLFMVINKTGHGITLRSLNSKDMDVYLESVR